jgi:hypothetical protein
LLARSTNGHGIIEHDFIAGLPPEQLADDILEKERRISELIEQIKQLL